MSAAPAKAAVSASLSPVSQSPATQGSVTQRPVGHRAARPAPATRAAASAKRSATPGKRVAGKRVAKRRSPLLAALPSTPILVGVAALAVSATGAISVAQSTSLDTVASTSGHMSLQASALSGSAAISQVSTLQERAAAVSRDSRRDALNDAAGEEVQEQAEAQARQRDAALTQFARQAEQHAKKTAENAWVLPVTNYRLTNTFGMARRYYSSGYHTGLDFAAPYGSPIMSVANGVVTEARYDGAYGNKIVVTLEDGTEIWYAHMSAYGARVGDSVRGGEVIGYVGSTGQSTGPHLHIEVRPGAGDPTDPYTAFLVNGLRP
ncbi:M23 family metallopeptidase [Nocardioides limicola]|uniref:M23 family metallopeptidase n=1 Tax=Nocardioides limicola TaxID=2803368 RepID=UPI00193C7ABD|nr:M23 family metallopeptidase [Nocardioides sp. DJM-14]